MGTYAQTKKYWGVTGNRPFRIFDLANVQSASQTLKTGLKKVTAYHINTSDPVTSCIRVTAISGGDMTIVGAAESQGTAYVWGLRK